MERVSLLKIGCTVVDFGGVGLQSTSILFGFNLVEMEERSSECYLVIKRSQELESEMGHLLFCLRFPSRIDLA